MSRYTPPPTPIPAGDAVPVRSLAEWRAAIEAAPVADVARRSAYEPAPRLSARLGNRVWLKREDQQPVFSFKLRGAYTRLSALDAAARARGVLAVSAGNHAQGLALGAAALGIDAVIVMPVTAPAIKVEGVRAHGARVVLAGDGYDGAAAEGARLCAEQGRVMVPPFDHPDIVAGQGTVAMELLADAAETPEVVFVPLGGGGLCAGMASYIKAVDPAIRVVAVEPEDAACFAAARAAGQPVTLDRVGLFVDGCAVGRVGAVTFEAMRHTVDEVVTVGSDAVCAAIRAVFEECRIVAEPAGALAIAGMEAWIERTGTRGRRLAAVLSGANTNFDRIPYFAERAEIGTEAEALFGVTIPERPGSFLAFARLLGRRPVTEFNYRRRDPGAAEVFVGVALSGGHGPEATAERTALAAAFAAAGHRADDLTHSELARLHVRHMVGGAPSGLARERFFRFEFPERPGALIAFLAGLGGRWDITLFHYRNRGAAYGRVLAGFAIEAGQDAALDADLDSVGYRRTEVSGDPALARFLG
ncbi:MAG: threonine ammonia-lyase, biosynthetic [Pseudomonadota bacterium]